MLSTDGLVAPVAATGLGGCQRGPGGGKSGLGVLGRDARSDAPVSERLVAVVLALSLGHLRARLDNAGVFLARLQLDQGRARGNTLAVTEQDAGDQLTGGGGDVDRPATPRHAQHPDLVGEGTRPDHRFRHGLTATAAGAAAASGTAALLFIIREGHPQNDGHDHKAQQNGGGDKEEMAFDHA